MSEQNDLEQRVEKLKEGQKEIKKEISFLRRKYNELINSIKSAGGYLANVDKLQEGDDDAKKR